MGDTVVQFLKDYSNNIGIAMAIVAMIAAIIAQVFAARAMSFAAKAISFASRAVLFPKRASRKVKASLKGNVRSRKSGQ